ncbi:bifunctional helix-turn-helix transcriptional regulator/GNAT family N-acetyltransferase [Bosea sp. (in: a-proteobacteria)]|uniref:bifunctional helix-turn-helix transcriptional regulator/GNAT family N-acetyltransferase n=1 Tax=Bosea sp. (in: a-proteobacteria) TaxID=1871050 RepID=UPI003B3BBD5B
MSESDSEAVAAIRRFNRFHTRWVGALGGDLHGSGLTLTEARVLYELAQIEEGRAGDLAQALALDPAYLSRILKRFEAQGWLIRQRSAFDGRAFALSLTGSGRGIFASLERASRAQAERIVARLSASETTRLITALGDTEALLGGGRSDGSVSIREHRPGDMGWVVGAHARLYCDELGWDIGFEALVAEIAGEFLRNFKPGRERCFMADVDGSPAGSAFVVEADDMTAKLRLVLVEKRAQGRGLGKRLVAEAIGFARLAGYRRMVLWTNDVLHAARAIYAAEGFRLVAEERHRSFGQDLVGETWELDLSSG